MIGTDELSHTTCPQRRCPLRTGDTHLIVVIEVDALGIHHEALVLEEIVPVLADDAAGLGVDAATHSGGGEVAVVLDQVVGGLAGHADVVGVADTEGVGLVVAHDAGGTGVGGGGCG